MVCGDIAGHAPGKSFPQTPLDPRLPAAQRRAGRESRGGQKGASGGGAMPAAMKENDRKQAERDRNIVKMPLIQA